MRTFLFVLFALLQAPLAWGFTIATGPEKGTYFQIAQDIKALSEKEGVELKVVPSKGSFENVELLATGRADLAIVQLDALRYLSDVIKAQAGVNVLEKVKVVLNLYPEEIHILSNKKEIASFYHLEGKRVSTGPQESGSALTSELLFTLYDIKTIKSHEAHEEALKKLAAGELDAMVFVGGAPVPFISQIQGALHLVRLPASPVLDQIYSRKKLGKDIYPWLDAEAETYAVPSAVMGLDIRDDEYVSQMQRLVLSVLNGTSYLETNGHPKWRNSWVRFYFPNVGYEPTNRIIESFNTLDKNGYRIVKK
jgi:TRAP transporter TAXI family solute receptor